MGLLLKIVGGLWALLGVGNIVYLPGWGQPGGPSAALTWALMFNMILFVLPGLIVYGVGSLVSRRSSRAAEQAKCPDCAELVLREARVCKHCGCKLVPQTEGAAPYSETGPDEPAAPGYVKIPDPFTRR